MLSKFGKNVILHLEMAQTRTNRLCLFLFLSSICRTECGRPKMKDVLDELFVERGYDRRVRPGVDDGVPTNISIDYWIVSIVNVDDVNMDFEVIMYFRHTWLDSRLSHHYGKELVLEPATLSQVWQPDLTFIDDKRGMSTMTSDHNGLIWIEEDGTIYKSIRITLKLTCEMSLERYPMDIQTCYIRLESYGHPTKDMVLMSMPDDDGEMDLDHVKIAEFDIEKAVRTNKEDVTGIGQFHMNILKLTLKRKFFAQFITTYIPTMLIVIMSWVTFWIKPAVTTPRISVGLLTVLTMTTMTSSLLSQLPRVTYLRAVDVWIFNCLLFVVSAFLETVLVIVLHTKRGGDSGGEKRDQVETSHQGAKEHPIVSLVDPSGDNLKPCLKEKESGFLAGNVPPRNARDHGHPFSFQTVDKVCRLLFPGGFIGFCICYFVKYVVY